MPYADTSAIIPGNLVQSTPVKTAIDAHETVIVAMLAGSMNHAKVSVTGGYHFAPTAITTSTIVSGEINLSTLITNINTEAAAASDDLDKLTLTSSPGIFIIKNNVAGKNVTLRHGIGGGNITTSTGANFTLNGLGGSAIVVHDGTTAFVTGYDNQHEHTSAQVSGLQTFVDARINAIVAGGVTYVYATDLSVVTGESVTELDACFINPGDGKAYKLDNATSGTLYGGANISIRYNENYGINITAGTTSAGGTITLRTNGEVSGYSGLTPNTDLFVGTMGALTATAPSTGVIVVVATVKSAGVIVVVPGNQATYGKSAAALYEGDMVKINHSPRRNRPARFMVKHTNTSKKELAISRGRAVYGIDLRVAALQAAFSMTTATSSGTSAAIGRTGNIHYERGQVFRLSTVSATYSRIKQATVTFGSNVGTPIGNLIARLRTVTVAAATGLPSTTILASSAPFAPAGAGTHVIPFPDAPIVQNNTWYSLTIEAEQLQADAVYWQLSGTATSTYADGQSAQSLSGAAWVAGTGVLDYQMVIESVLMQARSSLSQAFTPLRSTGISKVTVYMNKSMLFTASTVTGVQAHVFASSAGAPTGSALASSQFITVSELALSTGLLPTQGSGAIGDYVAVDFNFAGGVGYSAGVQYHVVVTSNAPASSTQYMRLAVTDHVLATAGLAAFGALHYQDGGGWIAEAGVGGSTPTALVCTIHATDVPHAYLETDPSNFTVMQGNIDYTTSSNHATTLTYNGTEILTTATVYLTL